MNTQTQKYTFHVHGMHCNACTILIESELNNLPGVIHAKADLHRKSLEVIGDFGNKTPQEANMQLRSIPKKPNMNDELDWNEIFS